jgi:hypothetical protein
MAGVTPNPKKRSFLLPPGCKDLHDLLQRQRPDRKPTTKYDDPIKGRISELERHLVRMAASIALIRSLQVHSSDHEFSVRIHQARDLPMTASLSLEIGSRQDKIMREFCTRHNLPLPDDTGMPPGFLPDLPVSQIYRLSSLPSEIPQAAKLLIMLFQKVGGLDEQTEIYFLYDETTRFT